MIKDISEVAGVNLGIIGNCRTASLLDTAGRIVWWCFPRFDADPVFARLLAGKEEKGFCEVALEGAVSAEAAYVRNTAIIETILKDAHGNAIRITDFSPRFRRFERVFNPPQIFRRIEPLSGLPRIRIRARPTFNYGELPSARSFGSNHIRYSGGADALRLTSDGALSYIANETPFALIKPVTLILGPDEPFEAAVDTTAREFLERTRDYWLDWVRSLAIPLEFQSDVIRAAITLKLCNYEETGAIIAAHTTSIPEAPGTQRNWDYRYCWLRDAFFVVRALNLLSEVDTMEHYLRYLGNIVGQAMDGHLQPVYGIALERSLAEREVATLAGYRGMGPVRVGNQAYEHLQHDVYGNVVLATAQSFFDRRLLRPATDQDFVRLERVGEQAYRVHATADASMWELRTRERVHTSSALMCWAACDRLARIAAHRRLAERQRLWQDRAAEIRGAIESRAFDAARGSFMESFGGSDVEAGILLMAEVGFLPPADPRFAGTVALIEERLRR